MLGVEKKYCDFESKYTTDKCLSVPITDYRWKSTSFFGGLYIILKGKELT